MTKRPSRFAVLVVLTFVATIVPAKPLSRPRVPELVPGESIQARLPVVGRDGGSLEFSLTVPENAFYLDITLADSPADLDIFIHDSQGELIAYSELSDYNERLSLSRIGDPPLEPARYTVEIVYQFSTPPIVANRQLTEIPFTLTVTLSEVRSAGRLSPGDSVRGVLRPENGMVEAYEIDVPTGTPVLRLDISDTDGDVDLFVTRDRLLADPFEADFRAQSVRSTEVLVLDRSSVPSLRPGTYYALVIDQIADDYEIPFTLTVSDTSDAPSAITGVPPLPVPVTEMDRAILATVEILTENSGGSGCIVSPDGYVLTNFHVVRDDSGASAQSITVGLSTDLRRPPVESYTARVVEFDRERDLALLHISESRYGTALPEGTIFPYVELADTTTMTIGDPLRFIGYPWIGGTGSRASVTYTRGVISGYQAMPYGYLIKTDGEINEGNSGGAALNDAFELVGLPTQVVGADGGQLAYIVPVDIVPDSWRRFFAPRR